MCPVCLAAAALLAGKATGAGGLAAVALRKLSTRKRPGESSQPIHTQIQAKEDGDGKHDDGS
jgi:hypothetical protein